MAKTFEYDEELPNLPLPELKETLDLYIESLKPLVRDDKALEESKSIVKDFQTRYGHLQDQLAATNKRNWLEDIWLKYAYLKSRPSLLFSSNFAGNWITPDNPLLKLFSTTLDPDDSIRCRSAAALLHRVCQCWQTLRSEALPPFKDGQGKYFSMHQFKFFFNTSRVPCEEEDQVATAFKTKSQGSCPSHIVVLYKGRFFSISPFDKKGENLCSEVMIEKALKEIEAFGDNDEAIDNIGPLSCDNRDTWSKHFNCLQSNNPETMKAIQEAICLVILSDLEPTTYSQQLKWTLVNDGIDIWADKSLAFVCFKNGVIGSQSDHTPFDGMVSAEVCAFCLNSLRSWKPPSPEEKDNTKKLTIKHLSLTVPEEVKAAIPFAQQCIIQASNDLNFDYHVFPHFGKEKLKEFRLHPDAFVQVVLQAAVYFTHDRMLPTYETATTRQFYHGRTETVRSCTEEALAFAKALKCNQDREGTKEKLLEAIAKHLHLMERGKDNRGCDRHLLGLKVTALEKGESLPRIFEDASYKISGGDGNFAVSTSLCGYSAITGGCPPMIKDGYGVFYGIPSKSILIWITSHKSSAFTTPELLQKNFFETLVNVARLFEK